MSTYVLMKILESAPSRYDRGIKWLTLGQLDNIYDRLVINIDAGQKVLDIGCGTGALLLRAALRGAQVKGIDINAEMLEIARKRVAERELSDNVDLVEMGVAELDQEESEIYDLIMSSLCFSELNADELGFTLKEARRILKPGGRLLIADEVRPKNILLRLINWFVRIPLVIITYLFTQTTTRAVIDLPMKMRESGFQLKDITFNKMGNFMQLVGQKPNTCNVPAP